MSAQTMRAVLLLADFGAEMKAEREREGYSPAGFVKHMGGVLRSDLLDWEAGYEAPPKAARNQIYAVLHRLRRHEPDLQSRNFQVVERPAPQPEPELRGRDGSAGWGMCGRVGADGSRCVRAADHHELHSNATFGEHLRRCRERADVPLSTVAELCGITGPAVGFWEQDIHVPVLENYEKLLSLFPELVNAPKPSCQDIDVPVAGKGQERASVRVVYNDPPLLRDYVPNWPPPITSVQTTPRLVTDDAAAPPPPIPPLAPEPMPEPTPATPPVSLPAIVRWTKATSALQLDKAQADALAELLEAGALLGLGVADVGQVLQQWPARTASGIGR